eukprot:496400-Pyramimonas_sp.AAC.1
MLHPPNLDELSILPSLAVSASDNVGTSSHNASSDVLYDRICLHASTPYEPSQWSPGIIGRSRAHTQTNALLPGRDVLVCHSLMPESLNSEPNESYRRSFC